MAQRVAQVPDGVGPGEQRLQLVAEGDGEARRERLAVARVEVADGAAQIGLEAGADLGGKSAGADGVGDASDVGSCHFSSIYLIVT